MLDVYLRYPLGSEGQTLNCAAVVEVWPHDAGALPDGGFDVDVWEASKMNYPIRNRKDFYGIWRMLRLLSRHGGGISVFSCFCSDIPVALP